MMVTSRSSRSVFFAVAAACIAAACLYLSFELGRYQAGFSLFDERERLADLNARLAERNATIDELQRRQAILETSVEIDAETYTAVEAELAALQENMQGLEEELAFYQGIVSPGDRVAGLRIQNVEIAPAAGTDGAYLLRLLLVQSIVHNDRVAGTVRIGVSGMMGGEAAVLGLNELTPDSDAAELPYGFRYFQSIERILVLAPDFMPEQLEIEIWPTEPRGDTVTQYFPWAQVVGG